MIRQLKFKKYNKDHRDKIIKTSKDLIIIESKTDFKLILCNYTLAIADCFNKIDELFETVEKALILLTIPDKVQKTLKDFGYCDFETIEKNNTIAYMISEKF